MYLSANDCRHVFASPLPSLLALSLALCHCCVQANWLRAAGVKKGDAVAIYMPMLLELPLAMLACARIGAVHSVVFGGFSAEALGGRMEDCKAKVRVGLGVGRPLEVGDGRRLANLLHGYWGQMELCDWGRR